MGKPSGEALRRVQKALASLMKYRSGEKQASADDYKKGQWILHCGEERFDWEKMNGLILFNGDLALNFHAAGIDKEITKFEAGVYWRSGWALMLHHDPKQATTTHPEKHIQFDCADGRPPFADWRVPADGDFFCWIEFIAAMLTSRS